MKFIFKWLLRLFILAVVMVVIVLLSFNSIVRNLIEHRIRTQTGMDAEIGSFRLGITEPTVEIQNFKLYNPPDFGGTPFLDIPEIHVEYDRAALAKHEFHITLMRFNLGELDVVKNQAGQTNLFLILAAAPVKKAAVANSRELEKRTGVHFTDIDVLNISIGMAKFIDLKDQNQNRTMPINIQNVIIKNVRSPTDLAGLAALIYLRSGYMIGLPGGPQQPKE
ncbi:MAG: hypothetical protein ABSG87_02365 [Verrucomicrobiota bacterium]|jgi:uncharacterized protein involved in outer membrane biogenesis